MTRTLIVARMKGSDAGQVEKIFAESDAGELPTLLGVQERRLYRFHDLYFHCIDSDEEIAQPLAQVREHPLFVDINRKLSAWISAYDPLTWRSPRDAMAEEFYHWHA